MSENREINRVQVLIRRFEFETEEAVKSAESALSWLVKFRDTLRFQGLAPDPMPYAKELLDEAMAFNDAQRKRALSRWNKSESVGDTRAPGVVTGTPAPAGNGSGRRKSITRQDVVDFAVQNGLDVNDACECYDATVERGGRDADGKAVKNWKGYVTQWCETRKESRREK